MIHHNYETLNIQDFIGKERFHKTKKIQKM